MNTIATGNLQRIIQELIAALREDQEHFLTILRELANSNSNDPNTYLPLMEMVFKDYESFLLTNRNHPCSVSEYNLNKGKLTAARILSLRYELEKELGTKIADFRKK